MAECNQTNLVLVDKGQRERDRQDPQLAHFPGIQPAEPRPINRMGLVEFLYEGRPMTELGLAAGRGLLVASEVGQAIGYATSSFSTMLGREWSERLTFETWVDTPVSLQAEIDRAEDCEVHIVKVEGEMLNEFKALDKSCQTRLVAPRARHLYLVTYVGVFHICERLSTKPKAKVFQSFMNTRGRRALETGQALTHDVAGNELPPPTDRQLLVDDRPLAVREMIDLALSLSTIDRSERERFVMELLQQGTPTPTSSRPVKLTKPNEDLAQMHHVSKLRAPRTSHARAKIDRKFVNELAAAYRHGAPLPPLTVYFDGVHYHVGDGFHRLAAAKRAKLTHVPVVIHDGTSWDAALHSIGSCDTNGRRRTNADKRRAVQLILDNEIGSMWSNRKIAESAKVSHTLVSRMRRGG